MDEVNAAAPPMSVMKSRRPMPDMGGPSLRDYRIVSLPPSPWQVLGTGLNCSESDGCALAAGGEGAMEGGVRTLPTGKVTGTNREVEAVVAASAARTAASSFSR
jgi:hypothetical protein